MIRHPGLGDAADRGGSAAGSDDPAASMMLDLRADYHGHVIDYVCDYDRIFLAAHPEVDAFERPAVEHEFCDMIAASTPGICLDFEGVVVRVTRIAEGVRARRPLWDGMVLPLIRSRWPR
jgi:hypothetical protein